MDIEDTTESVDITSFLHCFTFSRFRLDPTVSRVEFYQDRHDVWVVCWKERMTVFGKKLVKCVDDLSCVWGEFDGKMFTSKNPIEENIRLFLTLDEDSLANVTALVEICDRTGDPNIFRLR
jgi:hypothetical protein